MRLTIVNEKQDLIKSMIDSGRCYYLPDEGGVDLIGNPNYVDVPMFVLVRRLTTAVVIAPQYDLHSESNPLLIKMLNKDIHFNGVLLDYEILNAISYIPPQKPDDPESFVGAEMTMAMVLMLMVEHTINPNKPHPHLGSELSFFSVCRFAQLKLKNGQGYSPADLKKKLEAALSAGNLLNQNEDGKFFKKLVEDWSTKGTFEICGVTHSKDNTAPNAHYLNIVKQLHSNGRLQLSDIISLAVGMEETLTKPEMLRLSVAQRREKVFGMVKLLCENTELRNKFIEHGDEIRKYRMEVQIYADCPNIKPIKICEKGRSFFEDVLGGFSESVLRIYEAQNSRIAYAADNNLERLYPKGRLPGFTTDDCNITRISKGANLSRYGLMLISKGNVLPLSDEEKTIANLYHNPLLQGRDRDIAYAQQTILHESVHAAFNRLILEDKYPELYKETKQFKLEALEVFASIAQLPDEILNQKCLILGGQVRTIKEVLDQGTYAKYKQEAWGDEAAKNDAVAEEMVANFFGLRHSIFSEKNKPGFNPFITDMRYPQLDALVELGEKLDNLVERISYKLSGIEIPLGKFTGDHHRSRSSWAWHGGPA
jgi:hypothetical protein